MADALPPGDTGSAQAARCPYCQSTDHRVRSIRYAKGRKIESRDCACGCPYEADAAYAISADEARGLSGERTGS